MKHTKFLLFLFLFSLCIRALFFALYLREDDRCIIGFDGEQYQNIAENIVEGNGIAQAPGEPNFYRLPGYPLFLASCYKILGINIVTQKLVTQKLVPQANTQTSHHAVTRRPGLCKIAENVLWLQLILASFIPLLVFWLSLVLLPSFIILAKIAGLWAAVHVGFVLYAGMLASESLFLLLFLLFLCLFFSHYRLWLEQPKKFSWADWVSIGVALGLASLVRAVGHYVIILLMLMVLVTGFTQKEKIKAIVSLFFGWLSVIGWWLLRNYLLAGFLFFHTLPGLHFLQYPAVHAIMGYPNFGDSLYFETKKQVLAEWDKLIKQQEQKENRILNEYERYAIAERLAGKHILQRPIIAFKNACVQMAKTCCTLYSSLLLYVPAGTVYEKGTSLWFKIKLYLFPKTHEPWVVWVVYWEVLYFLFMLVGLIIFFVGLPWEKTYCIIALKIFPIMGLFIFITLGYGCARLRLPIEPFLMILSLLGWRRIKS